MKDLTERLLSLLELVPFVNDSVCYVWLPW